MPPRFSFNNDLTSSVNAPFIKHVRRGRPRDGSLFTRRQLSSNYVPQHPPMHHPLKTFLLPPFPYLGN